MTATIPPPPPSTACSDREAMLRTILEYPDADAPRLVYADWLDDIGDNYAAYTLRWFLDRPEYRQSVGINNFVPSMTNYFGSGEVCGVWNRGFGCEIRLPCADFMRHAREIFQAHPVTRVVLVDKRPYAESWFRESAGLTHPSDPASDLPDELFALTKPEFQTYCGFSSESAANDALSAACVSYGRSLAGLQPLPQPITQPCEH